MGVAFRTSIYTRMMQPSPVLAGVDGAGVVGVQRALDLALGTGEEEPTDGQILGPVVHQREELAQ